VSSTIEDDEMESAEAWWNSIIHAYEKLKKKSSKRKSRNQPEK